ncbi:MAG TPA: sugar phosphate isomerase/epimerase family protein, partial [Pirellulaceae bacterium]|nr:sugar phosphate isomerase/epimerase family protein [Pirellulaceae bacterium]
RDAGLQVSSLSWAGGFTGSDGRSHKECIEDALDAVRVAHDLHASCLVVHTGARAGHTHNHARRLVKTALVEIAELARDLEVVIALEPMHPDCASEWTFLTTLAETRELLGELNSPVLKLALDTYHVCQDDFPCSQAINIEDIALVQLGDARLPPQGEQNRCRLGEGTLPLASIVANLIAAGYRGYWEIELLGEDVETTDYDELIAQSQAMTNQWFSGARKIA